MTRLEELKQERAELKEKISLTLEAGQEGQSRNARFKMVNIQTLYNRLAIVEALINDYTKEYSDVEQFVYRGCR